MTNTEKLKTTISESGFKMGFLASQLGITRAALYNKINGVRPFKAKEMLVLCQILSIKNPVEIFLDQ